MILEVHPCVLICRSVIPNFDVFSEHTAAVRNIIRFYNNLMLQIGDSSKFTIIHEVFNFVVDVFNWGSGIKGEIRFFLFECNELAVGNFAVSILKEIENVKYISRVLTGDMILERHDVYFIYCCCDL